MKAICTSETSVDFQWTLRHYIKEYSNLRNHHCDNLKSSTLSLCPSFNARDQVSIQNCKQNYMYNSVYFNIDDLDSRREDPELDGHDDERDILI
jgi:hypothetical protein